MPTDIMTPGIVSGRLEASILAENFTDLHAPLDAHEALVAADRCYFCYDAPCMTACPTEIDVPLFIRQILTGTAEAAARTIFKQNIMGGMCARVCPTETLCEHVCVRTLAEGRPVEIGRLQRFATDALMCQPGHPFARAKDTGKSVAVVGAGPAGLACAHRLAMLGHTVIIHDARQKAGGLNEFGIAAYKSVDGFAQAEVDWLLSIEGVTLKYGQVLGDNLMLDELQREFDAIFLGVGQGGVNALGVDGEDRDNVSDAVSFISELRQSRDLGSLPVGRRVVVIGGGMTAVDAAIQSRLLGAEEVTIVYRRSREKMRASEFEQELAASKGVRIIHNAQPIGLRGNNAVDAVEFARTKTNGDQLEITRETFTLRADQVFKAIGQRLDVSPDNVAIEGGKIHVSDVGRTSLPGVWAGGDCATGGEDLTVTAVAQGRDAAMDIHATLTA